MTIINLIFLLILRLCLCNKLISINNYREDCGEKNLIGHHGVLTSPNYPNRYPENINCTWFLYASHDATIITILITKLDIEDEKCQKSVDDMCCKNNFLLISNKTLCGTHFNPHKVLSTNQSSVKISFSSAKNSLNKTGFYLIFSLRNKTECAGYDLPCADGNGCYNSGDICNLRYECADHSDEINCGKCGIFQTSCNSDSNICFDPLTERCNGITDCPLGEDEHNCSKICPNRISCLNGKGCYIKTQTCDQRFDCSDGSDEIDCTKKICGDNSFLCNNGKCIDLDLVENGIGDCGDGSDESKKTPGLSGFLIVLVFSLAMSFIMLIYQWCSSRRDVHHLMLDLPQFPLPPFRGPADVTQQNCQIQYSESDFRNGGSIYEAFVHARRAIRPIHQSNRCVTTLVMPKGEERVFTEYRPSCGTIALISLGINPDCSQDSRRNFFEKCEIFCEYCHNLSIMSDSTNTSNECRLTEVSNGTSKDHSQQTPSSDLNDKEKRKWGETDIIN